VIFVSIFGRGSLVAVVVALLMLGGAGQAGATMPWWHVNTVSAPTSVASIEGRVVVEVSNVGDAMANGFEHPVTVVEKLPAGVTATRIYGEGGGSELNRTNAADFMSCTLATLTCTYSGPVLAYERLMIAMTVKVAPGAGGGENEVNVSGGGAQAVTWRHALALGDAPPPYGVENYELTPEEEGGAPATQAGSHPFQLTTTLGLNTQAVPVTNVGTFSENVISEVEPLELTKDLRFNVPAGLIGNPTPIPQCSLYVFTQESLSHGECPADTAVGVATVMVTNPREGTQVPWAESKSLYNITPSVGEPAKFGFNTLAGPVILNASVRTGGDYGVVITVPDIIQNIGVLGSQVTFWGDPSDPRHDTTRGAACLDKFSLGSGGFEWEHPCTGQVNGQPFLILPTSCTGPLRTSVEGDSWEQPGKFLAKEYSFVNNAGEPYGLDGCNRLNFEPSIKVAPDGQAASTPTGLTVDVHVPQDASVNPTGLAESTVRDTTVTLPAGVALNPAGADGLQACGLQEIGLESAAEQTCPEAAKVGTVEIHTPLLPNPLVGAAYLATQNANPFQSLVALYIVARDPISGVLVKLAGQVTPDPVTGQLVSTFKETPQLPFEDLSLHFFGGSRAPLGTPALCGTYTTTASIAPWSGNAPAQPFSQFQITSGPNGSACSNPLSFKPMLAAGTTSIQAGGYTPFRMTMSREDGEQGLQSVQLKMPPGLLGTLSTVKLCGEPQADAGTCGPESLIGHTIVSVGVGGNPYSVTGGQVFITGPYDGAPYGLSIVNPAKAGPFNLGNVVVRAKIEVDRTTAALTITTDPSGPYAIPHILDGIPLEIKHVNVSIDRPGFTFNPTNCSPLTIGGSLGSSEGSRAALSVPFQVTNCAVLAFKPRLAASTAGRTSKLDGASLTVKLGYPAGPYDANIARVKVELPKALPSRLPTLQKACLASVFEANPAACPAGSIIGHATASTPVLPVPLTGPAYFVSHGGEAFPSLIIVLQGYGSTVDLVGSTFISKTGVTSSTFKTIPDVPVGTFELTLPQGPFSALAENVSLCKSKLTMPTEFVGQNGVVLHQSTKIAVTGCPKAKKAAHHPKKKVRKRAKRGGQTAAKRRGGNGAKRREGKKG
jgi:hypothetical protein